jgi:hypothetical protein
MGNLVAMETNFAIASIVNLEAITSWDKIQRKDTGRVIYLGISPNPR